MLVKLTEDRNYEFDWDLAKEVIREAKGTPVEVGRLITAPVMAEHEKHGRHINNGDLQGVELKLETDLGGG